MNNTALPTAKNADIRALLKDPALFKEAAFINGEWTQAKSGATFGVIPRGMLPYRCLPVERLEAWMDDGHCVAAPAAGGGARPPPASEVERGCLERAQENLLQRIPFLSGLLGQRLPLLACGDIRGFWRALRSLGRLAEILVHLAGNFKTSLLRDYLSLLPHWQRREAPS